MQVIAQKVKNGQISIVIDPFDATVTGIRLSPMECDILAFTGRYNQGCLKPIKGNPFLINSPGEYEVKEISIFGIPAVSEKSESEATIFVIEAEEIEICHLGQLTQKELTEDQVEKIGDIDVLMVPVGGDNTLGAEEARKIILQIEPKIVIPIYYRIPGLKIKLDSVDSFLKKMGAKVTERLDKLSLKRKDLTNEETKVIVLNP